MESLLGKDKVLSLDQVRRPWKDDDKQPVNVGGRAPHLAPHSSSNSNKTLNTFSVPCLASRPPLHTIIEVATHLHSPGPPRLSYGPFSMCSLVKGRKEGRREGTRLEEIVT